MKLVDAKGKLFGKISVIDLLVLLVVLAVAVVLVVKLAFPGEGEGGVVASGTKLTYTVRVTEVDPASYETVARYVDARTGIQDQLMASGSLLNGYVTACDATPHVTYVEGADGTVTAVESSGDDTRLDLLFTIVVYVESTTTNTVGTQEVRAGKNHTVKTTHFEFEGGTILGCTWEEART